MRLFIVLFTCVLLTGCSCIRHKSPASAQTWHYSPQILTFRDEAALKVLKPEFIDLPAVAYQQGGGSIYSWDVKSQEWK